MPLHYEWQPAGHALAAIWNITEDEDFFKKSLLDTGDWQPDSIADIKHAKRRLEHLAGRYLLQYIKVDFPVQLIRKDPFDKPRLPENRYYFSISHSFPFVTVIISDSMECGIDIQTWHRNIEGIQHMFLSEREQAFFGGDPRLITLAWCAKEAAYKWNGRRGIDFIQDMPVTKFELNLWQMPAQDAAYFSTNFQQAASLTMLCRAVALVPECRLTADFALSWIIQSK